MKMLLPKLIGNEDSYDVKGYKGLGHIPKGLQPKSGANKRILLDQLPRLLRGYGRVPEFGCIIISCDLDDRDKKKFLDELNRVLDTCNPKPSARFCLAIEEFEAWYLGDLTAIRKAYPKVKDAVLSEYKNDSICGTWEILADAVCKGGSRALIKEGYQAIGRQKAVWAEEITPHMNIDKNISPSFKYMLSQVRSIIAES